MFLIWINSLSKGTVDYVKQDTGCSLQVHGEESKLHAYFIFVFNSYVKDH